MIFSFLRNSEKRKEKSRDAARCRRGRETEIFSELAEQIPQYSGSHGQLDKASIMRLAISHLKISKIMETQRNNSKRHTEKKEFYNTIVKVYKKETIVSVTLIKKKSTDAIVNVYIQKRNNRKKGNPQIQ